MNRFTRFALAIATAAITLSGCAESPTSQTVSSHIYVNDTISICGEPGYQKDGSNYEVTVEGVCALVNEYYDPTTKRNRAVFEYVISPERKEMLHAAYTPFATMLRDKMLSGEIPYRVHGDMLPTLKRSGHVLRAEDGDFLYKPLPSNGWVTMESVHHDPETGKLDNSGSYIWMKVYLQDGKIDMSVEPEQLRYSRGAMEYISMNAPFSVTWPEQDLVYNTAETVGYYYSFDRVFDITLIDYIKVKDSYKRSLTSNDKFFTVLSRPLGYNWMGRTTELSVNGVKLVDRLFIAALAKVEVNGSDWKE